MTAVLVSVRDGVATLTLNRPEKLNAFRREDYDTLIAALDQVEADDAVRATVLTGAGRGFCAGTDLSAGFDLPVGGDPSTGEGVPPDLGGRVALRLFRCSKPLIAAVNGAAMGFGASLTLPCDFRIAATTARFGFVFSRRGIAADACSSWFLPRVVGLPRAVDWLLTGRQFEADEALASGLVSRLLPPEDLLSAAQEIGLDLALNCSPLSLALNRRLVWQMAAAPHPELAHRMESRAMVVALLGPDPAEGIEAYRNRRPPRFTAIAKGAAVLDD